MQTIYNTIYQRHHLRYNCRRLRSRGSTLRSKTRPLGRTDSEGVRIGNCLAARALLLCLLWSAKACWWVLEQPASSIMHLHPLFQYLIKKVNVRRKVINMSSFGAPTPKRTLLYSSGPASKRGFKTSLTSPKRDGVLVVYKVMGRLTPWTTMPWSHNCSRGKWCAIM